MSNNTTKPTIISAKNARVRFGEVLDEAFYKGREFLVMKKNKPMAMVIGMPTWEKTKQNGSQTKDQKDEKTKFKAYNMGEFKTPLTREYMYD